MAKVVCFIQGYEKLELLNVHLHIPAFQAKSLNNYYPFSD